VSIGPVEYILLGFPGNNFHGEIAPALARLIENGTVRIIDLVFISKDQDGDVLAIEFDQLEELAPYASLQGEAGGLVSEEDIAYAGAALEPNSSAALIVWEDTWATEFAEAVRNADGIVIEGARIPYELVEAAMADLGATD
jgi:translation initiation factor IF-2